MVPVKDDIHGWKNAFVGVMAHPFFAVTGPDGSFRIDGLPAGTYVVAAWHEVYGTVTQRVTVGGGQTGNLSFEFAPASRGGAAPVSPSAETASSGTGVQCPKERSPCGRSTSSL
jgi:hypothetical protein